MAAVPSLSLNWDAVLSTTLINYSGKLRDNISKANNFYYQISQKESYKRIRGIGDRAKYELMYEIGETDSYSGYDVLSTTPADGITSAFFDWAQASTPIAISGLEKKKNSGEAQAINLLEAKIKQAEVGAVEFFNKRLIIGAGGSSIASAYVSPTNGSSFVVPLPLLVKYDPTTSTVIGNLNQSTYSWWQNQTLNDTSTNFAGFLKNLRRLNNLCSKGPGGAPNCHLADQSVFELYESALADKHRNTSYSRADIPFDNIAFRGQPLTWDEFVPDVQGGSETQSTTSGTWWMLNTMFFEIQVEADTDFTPTKPREPIDQDASVQHILWLGTVGTSNRRKQGVIGGIDTTMTS